MSEIFGNGVMGGGGLTNSKLALADASPEDVRSGKKFYSGDKQLKTGTLAEVEGGVPGIVITDTGAIIATVDQPAGIVSESQHGAIKQMTTKQGETAVATDVEQTIVDEKVYTLGAVKIAPVASIIRVTYPAGSECTCAYTNGSWMKTDPAGVSVFILPAVGTYTVSITDGTQTATQTVEITETNRYANITLAYFSATISITYPANSTCTVTNADGATVVSDTNSGTEAKTWAATVGSTGTYTITATATDGSGKTKTTTVSITTNGQSVNVTVAYSLIVFNNGDQDTEVTGGITKTGYTLSGYNSTVNSQVAIGETIVLKGVAPGGATSTDKNGLVGTANIIDMSPYTTLRVKGTVTGWAPGAAVYMGVNKSKTVTRKPLAYISITANETNFERTLSLPSNQTELYVFALAARADGTTEKYTTTLTLTHISLE